MSKHRNFARGLEDAFYRMLDGGLFIGDTPEDDYDDEPEPTKASKEVYTWVAIFLKNYRDTEITVQDGGRVTRKAIVEVDDAKDIAKNLIEMIELRFIGKPIDDEKAKVNPIIDA